MQLRLRTKLTLVMTGLVLLVVAVLSGVFLAQLLQQTLLETDKRASELAHQVFVQAQHALTDAANKGLRPSSERSRRCPRLRSPRFRNQRRLAGPTGSGRQFAFRI